MQPTTMMLRNIPNKYTQPKLLQELDELGYGGTYNFFYLPMDVHNRSNVGYAFINFNRAADALRFHHDFSLHRFQRFQSRKVGTVCVAHVQGLDENLRHFENRAVTQAKNDQYRPIVFNGSQRIEFEEALESAKARLYGLSSQPPSTIQGVYEKGFKEEPRRGGLEAAILELLTASSPTQLREYPGAQEGVEDKQLLTLRTQLGERLRGVVAQPLGFEAASPPPGLAAPLPLSSFEKPPLGLVEVGQPAKIPVPSKLALPDHESVQPATYDDFVSNSATPRTNGILLGWQLGSMIPFEE
jgi:hypothetical protein